MFYLNITDVPEIVNSKTAKRPSLAVIELCFEERESSKLLETMKRSKPVMIVLHTMK